jgi:hypothetical protein
MTSMNFELVRIGWPNTAVILALALVPMVSLAAAPHPKAAAIVADAATICPAPQDGAAALATLLPSTSLE